MWGNFRHSGESRTTLNFILGSASSAYGKIAKRGENKEKTKTVPSGRLARANSLKRGEGLTTVLLLPNLDKRSLPKRE